MLTSQSKEELKSSVISLIPNLSHAWVISFVSIKALVDLFSQSSIFLRSPLKHDSHMTEYANIKTIDIRYILIQILYTCGNGLQGIP